MTLYRDYIILLMDIKEKPKQMEKYTTFADVKSYYHKEGNLIPK